MEPFRAPSKVSPKNQSSVLLHHHLGTKYLPGRDHWALQRGLSQASPEPLGCLGEPYHVGVSLTTTLSPLFGPQEPALTAVQPKYNGVGRSPPKFSKICEICDGSRPAPTPLRLHLQKRVPCRSPISSISINTLETAVWHVGA